MLNATKQVGSIFLSLRSQSLAHTAEIWVQKKVSNQTRQGHGITSPSHSLITVESFVPDTVYLSPHDLPSSPPDVYNTQHVNNLEICYSEMALSDLPTELHFMWLAKLDQSSLMAAMGTCRWLRYAASTFVPAYLEVTNLRTDKAFLLFNLARGNPEWCDAIKSLTLHGTSGNDRTRGSVVPVFESEAIMSAIRTIIPLPYTSAGSKDMEQVLRAHSDWRKAVFGDDPRRAFLTFVIVAAASSVQSVICDVSGNEPGSTMLQLLLGKVRSDQALGKAIFPLLKSVSWTLEEADDEFPLWRAMNELAIAEGGEKLRFTEAQFEEGETTQIEKLTLTRCRTAISLVSQLLEHKRLVRVKHLSITERWYEPEQDYMQLFRCMKTNCPDLATLVVDLAYQSDEENGLITALPLDFLSFPALNLHNVRIHRHFLMSPDTVDIFPKLFAQLPGSLTTFTLTGMLESQVLLLVNDTRARGNVGGPRHPKLKNLRLVIDFDVVASVQLDHILDPMANELALLVTAGKESGLCVSIYMRCIGEGLAEQEYLGCALENE
ncbi:hypothetical protein J1614_012197 [Plenodomus biglobosus]|nr:hypothetical protein J1614_012197 [Plenodomus biglobosus]